MLERLGHLLYRRRRIVLVATLLVVVVAGAFGGNVSKYLKAGGFDSPDVESQRASELLGEKFKQAPPNFLLMITAKQGTVDAGAAKTAGIAMTNELLSEPGVGQVISHWSLGPGSPLESKDRKKAIVIAEIKGNDDARSAIADRLIVKYNRDTLDVSVRVGGFEAIFSEVSDHIESDLAKAESIAIPVTLILLIIVFGSLIAAVLPVGIGIVSVLGTFLVLRIISSVTDVSVFALSMVTAMGLGLAIDYSLFIVSRFREETRKGLDTEAALVATVRTAGRTVIFSAITVAVSLAALLVFPLYFFKSFGYAGIFVVLTAMLGAVIALPALLATLGPRVDWAPSMKRPRPKVRPVRGGSGRLAGVVFVLATIYWYRARVQRPLTIAFWYLTWPVQWLLRKLSDWQQRHHKDVGEGFWHRLAVFVMRRPVPIAVSVVAVLLLLGVPFLHVNLGLPDERVLPPGAETRQVHDALRSDFSSNEVNSVRVVATGVTNPVVQKKTIATYAASLSKLDGVSHVDSLAGEFKGGVLVRAPGPAEARFASVDATWFQVIPSVDPFSKDGEDLVTRIRDGGTPFDIIVGGSSAQLVDAKESLFGALPWALGIIGVVTFLMLFLMFGSLLVPLKALVLNLLSLTATFGAMVWIFQDGHLSGFLNFTSTGTLDISSPILMFCIAFGLSMDFEVFMLSRIKEEYDATGDNEHSVAVGLELTGRIVTAAAVLISVTFLLFGMSSVRFIKLFGLGMALAVLMDAFVIRGTLVPAFMRLAGNANWWLPKFLRPVYKRFHISESSEVDHSPAPARAPARAPATVATRRPAAKAKATAKAKSAATRKSPAKRTNGRRPSAGTRKTTAKAKPSARKPVARKPAASRKAPAR